MLHRVDLIRVLSTHAGFLCSLCVFEDGETELFLLLLICIEAWASQVQLQGLKTAETRIDDRADGSKLAKELDT